MSEYQRDLSWRATVWAALAAEATGLTNVESYSAVLEHGIQVEARCRLVQGQLRGSAPTRDVQWYDGGSGPGLVLINGWTVSGLVWPAGLRDRLETLRRVIRVDNRGTGRSRGTHWPFTIADLARDVRRVIHNSGLEQATVVGFSMGGMVAQELALQSPELVSRLVLVSSRPPSPAAVGGPPGLLRHVMAGPATGSPLDQVLTAKWASVCAPGFTERHPDRLQEMTAAVLAAPTPRPVVLSQARAVAAWHGARRLRSLAVPCTVVHGALDQLSPPENGRRLAQAIPAASYVELTGVGHLVPYEAPDDLVDIIEGAT